MVQIKSGLPSTPTDDQREAPPQGAGPGSQDRDQLTRSLAWTAVLVGSLMALFAHPLVDWLTDVLPHRATLHGGGTNFPPFERAAPFMVRGIGVTLVLTPGIVVAARRISHHMVNLEMSRRASIVGGVVLASVAFAIFWWYSDPPNMFATNARIHWVDIFYSRRDDYFYALVKGVHWVFYDWPHLVQAVTGAANVVLVFLIGREITARRWTAILVAASFLGSTLVLLFADATEDVSLSFFALLVAALAYLRRARYWFGAAVFLTVLARPPFVALLVAAVVTEVVMDVTDSWDRAWRERWEAVRRNSMVWTNVASFALLFAAWSAVLLALDAHWLLNGTAETVYGLEAQEVDGFTIFPFSGVYVMHLPWVIPPTTLLALVLALVYMRRLPATLGRFVLTAILFTVLTVGLAEATPLLYYNIRYLSYVWPLLLFAAWTLIRAPWVAGRPLLAAGLALVLAVSPALLYRQDLHDRDHFGGDPLAGLYDDRHQLREIVGDRMVATTMSARSRRNYLAFLFQRPATAFSPVEEGVLPENTVVFTQTEDAYPDGQVLFRENGLFFVASER